MQKLRARAAEAGISIPMTHPYKPPEKWDVHTHTTLSPETYESLEKFAADYVDFIRVRAHATDPCCAEMVRADGTAVRTIESNSYEGAARIADCDRHGITVQVVSPTPMMIPDYVHDPLDAEEICKILNDDNAALAARFPGRFVALGALPLCDPDRAVREMERIRREHGMPGVEINTNIDGRELDEDAFFPVFEAATALGMAVFIHPWGGFMMPQEERLKRRMNTEHNWRPWLIGMGMETALAFDSMRCGGVHERLPGLRVLYAHGGGAFTGLIGRLEHGSYCRPDLFRDASSLDPFSTVRSCAVYTDSLTHSPWALEMLMHTIGVNRIAMGSDYPYPLGEIDPFDSAETERGCPYEWAKRIYPGHMIENLPGPDTPMGEAWQRFSWIPHKDAGGQIRSLPRLTDGQRQRMLSGTAKEWLGAVP